MESEFVTSTQGKIVTDGGQDKREDVAEVVFEEVVEEASVINNYYKFDCDNKDEQQDYYTRPLNRRATYELEKYEKKILLIFNHKIFDGNGKLDKTRHGTEKDVEALTNTFEKFGFEIIVRDNLSKDQVHRELEIYSNRDFTDYGCIMVAVLTHGKENLLRASDKDSYYSEVEILRYFSAQEKPTLVTKPRVLIVQACRGEQNIHGVPVPKRKIQKDNDEDEGHRFYLPGEADMLVLHSSYLGKPSFRDTEMGSWFIQSLCKKINELAATHDLLSIITEVHNEVAIDKHYQNFNPETTRLEINKQVPVFQSTLLHKLFLKKKGDAVPTFALLDNGTRSSASEVLAIPVSETPTQLRLEELSNDSLDINLMTGLLSFPDWLKITETHLQSAIHDEEDIRRLEHEMQKYKMVMDSINLFRSRHDQISDDVSTLEGIMKRYNRRFDAIADQVRVLSETICGQAPGPSTSSPRQLTPSSSSCPNLQHAHALRSTSPAVEIHEYVAAAEEPSPSASRRESSSLHNLQDSGDIPSERQIPSSPKFPPKNRQRSESKEFAVNCLLYKSVVRLFRILSKNRSEAKKTAKREAGSGVTQARSAPATLSHRRGSSLSDVYDFEFGFRSASVPNGPRPISPSSSMSTLTFMGIRSYLPPDTPPVVIAELREMCAHWK